MRAYSWVRLLCCSLGCLAFLHAHADVTLPALFSNHMILQRGERVPVWGWAEPGETVCVEIAGLSRKVAADAQGKWMVVLNLQLAERGPCTLTVTGKNRILLQDVLIGQVWLCAGQSNMGFLLKGGLDDDTEIAASANERLREFRVDKRPSVNPEERVGGEWRSSGLKTSGTFSAVAYYFGKSLQRELEEPVGLIHVSYGGTPIESWISMEGLMADAEIGNEARSAYDSLVGYPERKKTFDTQWSRWVESTHRGDMPRAKSEEFAAPDIPMDGWQAVSLPGVLDIGRDGGAVWVRKEIEIEKAWTDKKWPLYLGIPTHLEQVYWNGEKIGEMRLEDLRGPGMARTYNVPERLLKEGRNVLAVRLHGPVGPLGIMGSVNQLRLSTIRPLAGVWQARAEAELTPLTESEHISIPQMPALVPEPQLVASTLFNGAINPLIPYGIKGVIWYQGESNVSRAWQYRRALPLLIQDWRRRWGIGSLPVVLCQLASFQEKKSSPGESGVAELREAQAVARALPHVSMAVLIDQGEVDVHYRDKSEAGRRLALAALHDVYGRNISFSGPEYDSHTREGNAIRIRFSHADGGLVPKVMGETYPVATRTGQTKPLILPSPGSELQGFALCGPDRKWVWADARIDGDTVAVSSPLVSEPVAVRYAWAEFPTCNLFNGAGLPAAPFRTDDFPAVTEGGKYPQ
ncbi:MAG: hypothetical protein BGO12_03800 [Verrucomicrobia bacterium 61-8]|nr:MAG: hypothetical protein BGO12_03800 [Verrucomicrobia bacterium 61-8]